MSCCKQCETQKMQIVNSRRWNPEPLYSFQRYCRPDNAGDTFNVDLLPGQGVRFWGSAGFILRFTDPKNETTVIFPVANPVVSSVSPILELADFSSVDFFAIPSASGGTNSYIVVDVYERA